MEEQFFAVTGVRLKGLADCTIWIKWGSYYHGLVAKQGQLHKCPHLVGIEPPRGPQITPSESCQASLKKAEGPVTNISTPSLEASAPQGATTDAPAPMEKGGAGDSQSWVDQAQAENDFQKDRPAKHCQSHSRRREVLPVIPFPLQDDAGRHASVQQLYVNAGQQPPAPHNVATVGILCLHPEVLPHVTRSIGNQVLCMIAEYHLNSQVQGMLNLSLVLPEVAEHLLPPIEDYMGGGGSQRIRDMRVVERAKTLQIATWLHHPDMVVAGDVLTPPTLEATQHERGPLLDMLLAARAGNLTFPEVINHVLDEDWSSAESSLAELQECHAHIQEELDGLVEAHSDESDKNAQKRIKKEIDMKRKDVESLRVTISHHESLLGRDQDDDVSDQESGVAAETEMASAPETDNAPPMSATVPYSDPPPAKGQAHAMEVDEQDGHAPSASPVSPADDALLTGDGMVGIEGGMASLTVSSPMHPDGGDVDASI